MEPLHRLTAAGAARRIQAGRLSPVDLVEALLERIERWEPTLKAWVTVDKEGALAAARRLEHEAKGGWFRGPLHGVPVGVKDIFYTLGLRTTACSPLLAEFVPSYDSTAVARLKDAGAIILGKTVTTEFATTDPPPTRNPWDQSRTPGGSSSGSAVSVAVGQCPVALGSQTGGSTLRPAAYNGIVALKPTYGRISKYGVIPCAWTLDTVGIMARSVEDTALLLRVMAGHDPKDPTSSSRPVPDYVSTLADQGPPPRLGVLREFFWERSAPEVRRRTDEAVERLRRAGASVQEVALPPSFPLVHPSHMMVMYTEVAAFHQEWFPAQADAYGPKLRSLIERGLLFTGVEYLQAQRHRRRFRREMEGLVASADALLTPTTPSAAPTDLTTTGDPVFQSCWTYAGVPTITLPIGLDGEGMPLGLQLIGPLFGEERLLRAARWCEGALGPAPAPPGYE